MAYAGIPDIGDTATGSWGDTSVIGRVVSKSAGIQIAIFSDQPGPAQVVTVQDARFVKAAEPQWSQDLRRAKQYAEAEHERWREGIEPRRIAANERAKHEAEQLALIRQARQERGRDRSPERER